MSRILKTKRQKAEDKPLNIRKKAKVKVKKRFIGKHALTSAANIKRIERRRKAIILRRDGWEYAEIAEALGTTEGAIREDVKYCLNLSATELSETADEERELQKARLNAILTPNMRFATENHKEIVVDPRTGARHVVEKPPDPAYANVVLKIEERRSKLLALDKPETKKLEVTGIREYAGINMDDV